MAIAGVAVVVGQKDTDYSPTAAIINVVLSIIWLFVFPVLALFCWFMPVYTAYRSVTNSCSFNHYTVPTGGMDN